MAKKVLEIVIIDDDDDDEISVIYATPPPPVKNGATKSDAISVEDYHPAKRKSSDVESLDSFPKKRLFKGECSSSKSKSDTFVCEICTDEKAKDEIFRVLGCHHFYCSDCMQKYVASKLQDNVIAISCPVSGCKGSLDPHHCISILPKQVFDRWGDALCEAVFSGADKFYCPFKDCSAMLVHDNRFWEVIVESECPDCNRLFCAKCKVPWHSGIGCAEFQELNKGERSKEDKMLMKLAKGKKWARCPRCGIYIAKTEGCNHMLCRCGQSFDYGYMRNQSGYMRNRSGGRLW